jgi:hypothetical protein
MEKKRRTPREKSANLRVPETLTLEFCERVRKFSPSIKTDYLISSFLSKFVSQDTDPPEVRKARAIEKWLAVEQTNEATTLRLQTTPGEYQILPRVEFKEFVDWTRKFIETVIDPLPPFDSLIGAFSGGASTSRSRKTSHPAGKYLGKAHATTEALDLFFQLELEGWSQFWDKLEIVPVRSNVLFTVGKNAEIDRVCCKEPDINMFLQKGLGGHLRRRLRRFGINLNDQTVNQNYAWLGSVDDSLSTLDLSSASDSMSYGIVAELLPPFWFTLLDAVRCRETTVNGEQHRNEMFSSMGNGFTFELESLLFFALAKATAYFTGTRGVISIYGDDIICPRPMAHDLVWVLKYFGFSVNSSKSFIEGPFRESCGGHFHGGRNVTPFYLRQPMGCLTDVILTANNLRRWSNQGDNWNDPDTWETWCWLKSYVPSEYWGGRDYGDKCRLVTPDAPRKRLNLITEEKDNGIGGYIHWLNVTCNRSPAVMYENSHWDRYNLTNRFGWAGPYEPVETSTRSKETVMYRSKPVTEVMTQLADRFFQEL